MFKWFKSTKDLTKKEPEKKPKEDPFKDYEVLNNSLEDFESSSQALSACDSRIRY